MTETTKITISFTNIMKITVHNDRHGHNDVDGNNAGDGDQVPRPKPPRAPPLARQLPCGEAHLHAAQLPRPLPGACEAA